MMNRREAADARHALLAWTGKAPEPQHTGPVETPRDLPPRLAPPTDGRPLTGPASIAPWSHALLPLPAAMGPACRIFHRGNS